MRIVVYGDGRMSAGSASGPIGAAALPRYSESRSMMMRVLAGGRGAKKAKAQAMRPWIRAIDGT
jgi:hypothetical protein